MHLKVFNNIAFGGGDGGGGVNAHPANFIAFSIFVAVGIWTNISLGIIAKKCCQAIEHGVHGMLLMNKTHTKYSTCVCSAMSRTDSNR